MIAILVPHCRRLWLTRRVGPLLALSWVVLLGAGCDVNLPGKPNPKDRPLPVEKALAFETLYNRNCAGCHGPDGKQGPAPPLNDPLFRAIVPADELEMVLSQGRQVGKQPTPMPPFAHDNGGSLSPAQIQVLIHEIKGLPYRIVKMQVAGKAKVEVVADKHGIAPRWGPVSPASAAVPDYVYEEGAGNAAHGAKKFAIACASCHGDNGEGVVQAGQRRNKINEEALLALITDQALRRIIITGRPDLHMPNYMQKAGRPDKFAPLTSPEIDDLVALLASWRDGKSFATK